MRAGGVTREWYEVMAREICDPNLALFTSVPEHAQTFQPSPSAVIQSDGGVSFREYFRFAGRFVGKALADGQQLACYFTRSFYKHMLDVPLALADLEAVDPAYHKNLQARLFVAGVALFCHCLPACARCHTNLQARSFVAILTCCVLQQCQYLPACARQHKDLHACLLCSVPHVNPVYPRARACRKTLHARAPVYLR